MSTTFSTVSRERPETETILVSIASVLPDAQLREPEGTGRLEVVSIDGVEAFAVVLPRLIQVPGEVMRLAAGKQLIAFQDASVPAVFAPLVSTTTPTSDPGHEDLWWVDLILRNGFPDGHDIASRVAQNLAARTRGVTLLPAGEKNT